MLTRVGVAGKDVSLISGTESSKKRKPFDNRSCFSYISMLWRSTRSRRNEISVLMAHILSCG